MGRRKAGQLTVKQAEFVNHILAGKSGRQAVLAVYDSKNEKNAGILAANMLRNKDILAAIDNAKQAALRIAAVDASEVVRGFIRIAYFDIRSIVNDDGTFIHLQDLPEDVAKSISGVRVIEKRNKQGEVYEVVTEYKFESRIAALNALAEISKLKEPPKDGTNVQTIADLVRNAAELGRQQERAENPQPIIIEQGGDK